MTGKTTIIVHSGDIDKVISALIIANGSLSMGMDAIPIFHVLGPEPIEERRSGKRPA
jgi:peroxiredoxin family protein